MAASSRSLGDDIRAGRRKLTAVTDTEEEEAECLGFLVYSTTGEVLVPREWFEEQLQAEGLPEWLMPSTVWPSSAHKRALNRLVEDDFEHAWIGDRYVEFQLEDPDETPSRHRILLAKVYRSEAETGMEGGRVETINVGQFDYDAEAQGTTWSCFIEEDDYPRLHTEWKRFVGRMQGLTTQMATHHTGYDMRNVIQKVQKDYTNAIPMRDGGAVYFFPAHLEEVIHSLADIWSRMNIHKERGKRVEIAPYPVVDDDRRRELIQNRAEELIQEQVDNAIETGIETLQEAEEDVADEIAEDIVEELSETTSLAEEHSQLLDARLSVKRHIEDWMDILEDEKRGLVEDVLDQTDLPSFEADDEDDEPDVDVEFEADGGPDETGFIWGGQ